MIHRIYHKKSMNKMSIKNYIFTLLALFIALQIPIFSTTVVVYAQDQLRGFELYQEMGTPGFLQYEGSANIQWLPGDLGYLETKQVDGGTEFFAVDPENEERTSLFTNRQLRVLTKALEQEYGVELDALPFSSFDFVMQNQAIFFEYNERDHIFHLDYLTLHK